MLWTNPFFSFTEAAVIFNAPTGSGIYVLGIPHGDCLLVGEADHVRIALLELLERDTRWKGLGREIIFSTERVGAGSRAPRRRELVAEMKPRLNRVAPPA